MMRLGRDEGVQGRVLIAYRETSPWTEKLQAIYMSLQLFVSSHPLHALIRSAPLVLPIWLVFVAAYGILVRVDVGRIRLSGCVVEKTLQPGLSF